MRIFCLGVWIEYSGDKAEVEDNKTPTIDKLENNCLNIFKLPLNYHKLIEYDD